MKMGCFIGILMIVADCALSWLISCGLYSLVCLCFGWTFSWAIGTGIWIIWCVLRSLFSSKK